MSLRSEMSKIEPSCSRVSRYGQPVGRVMVREATLLKRQQVERMLHSDYRDALGVTFDTVYGQYLEGAEVVADIESGLERFLAEEYRFLDETCSGTLVAEFMHLKYDFHNIRVLAKRHFMGDSGDERLYSSLGTVALESLERALEVASSPGLPPRIEETVRLVRSAAERGEQTSQAIDTVIDRAYLKVRLKIAREEGSGSLEDLCRSAIDIANLNILLRGLTLGKESSFYEAALVEGGKLPRKELLALAGQPFSEVARKLLDSRYGRMLSEVLDRGTDRTRLTSLDRISDDYLMDKVNRFSRVSIGPERIIRYMMTRETEVAMLRLILVGKLNQLSTGMIESRLPDEYLKRAVG